MLLQPALSLTCCDIHRRIFYHNTLCVYDILRGSLNPPTDWSCAIPATVLCGPGERRRRRNYQKWFQKPAMYNVSILPSYCQSHSSKFLSVGVKVETLQNKRHRMMFISVCVCFLPLHVRLISSLFITVTHPSTVNWTSGSGASQRITLPSPICPGNFSVPLRPNLPILPPLRLYLSVTDRADTGKRTAGPSSNRIRDCGASARSVSLPHLLQ